MRAGALALLLVVGGPLGCGDGGSSDDPDAAPAPDAAVDATPPDAMVVVDPTVDERLVINEVMTDNALTVLDGLGGASDWVEIYNPTDEDVPLHGYALTDHLAMPNKAPIGPGVIAPAGGRVVVWLDGVGVATGHVDLQLARESGALALARADGSFIDRIEYVDQAVDFSAAREPDGSDAWVVEWHASPGDANPAGDGAPIAVEDLDAPPEQVPAAGDLTEVFLGYDALPELAIEVDDADVLALLAEPYVYVPGSLIYDGRAYGPVGVRLKGQNSFQEFDEKPSFRINVDEFIDGAKFFALDDLTLNNMANDPSNMHERLAYYVAREAGVPASRATHAQLTVNGELYGLYTCLETVKVPMLARWFADSTGPLFEATDVDFTAADVDDYILEVGPDDRALLAGLAGALAIADADDAMAAAAAHAHVPQFLRFWAMESVVGQFDSFPYSNPGDDYLVYADPASDRLWPLPWGMDETFFAADLDPDSQEEPFKVRSVFGVKCLASPTCYQAYVDAVWDVLALTEDLDLEAERLRVKAQIAAWVAADPRRIETTAQVAAAQDAMGYFIRERRLNMETYLPPPSGD